MEIGIIGAGRAGRAMGLACAAAGHRVAVVADLDPARAADLAGRLGARPLLPAGVAAEAAVVFLSVPDDAIRRTAEDLAPQTAGLKERVFFHLSGALPASLLAPLRAAGAVGSLHPLLTLTGSGLDAERLRGCYYAVEGDAEAEETARGLVSSLGGQLIPLRAEDKPLYHAAAVMLSNYLAGLYDTALGLYERIGLDRGAARAAVQPLLEASVANLGELGPEAALTGPISRGDFATVRRHLAALEPDGQRAGDVYRALGRATTMLALRAGRIGPEQARTALGILRGE